MFVWPPTGCGSAGKVVIRSNGKQLNSKRKHEVSEERIITNFQRENSDPSIRCINHGVHRNMENISTRLKLVLREKKNKNKNKQNYETALKKDLSRKTQSTGTREIRA